tara:strand:+ start:257 stop:850 length:594 start_codon:yes stop_codon:yes gene_type:complete
MVNSNKNPCIDYLSDYEYLDHMIPHHQVAVDMSEIILKKSNNPIILQLANKIKWQQMIEIDVMKWHLSQMKNKTEPNKNSKVINNDNFNITISQFYVPKMSSAYGKNICNPLFFNPDEHMNHYKDHNLSDQGYIQHMIPHHQVAVDMSKRLLKHSDSPLLRGISNKIIRDQEGEIYQMNYMLKNYNNWSNIKSDLLN